MSPNMKKKLERNIQYHQDVADFYAAKSKEEGERDEPDERAAPDQNQILVDLHSEVASQLREVVEMYATPPAILNTPPVFRNTGAELKPTAGRFH